mmetsp:Transcript_6609/g.16894  ORF Transcript_6609/g.16894 Transcript_6609/m.16894 type:complete len:227 (+) Transcript_6609:714-1394(+)
MGSPHFLAPAGTAPTDPALLAKWKTQSGFKFDPDTKRWTMPSIMAGVNTKVVGRSATLAPEQYGSSFAYDESDLCSGPGAAAAGTAAVGFFGAMLMFPPTRWLLQKGVLPKPGQGPSEKLRETGYAHVYVVGTGKAKADGAAGDKVVSHMEFVNADPGYKGTAAMAVEAALCLALPASRAQTPGKAAGGGCLTPATALGQVLVDRINCTENLKFEVGPLADTVIRG